MAEKDSLDSKTIKSLVEHLSSSGVRHLEKMSEEEKAVLGSDIVLGISHEDLSSARDITFSRTIKDRFCDETIRNLVSTFNPRSDYFRKGAKITYEAQVLGFVKVHKQLNFFSTSSVATFVRGTYKFPIIKDVVYSFDSSSYKYLGDVIKKHDDNSWVDLNFKDLPKPIILKPSLIVHRNSFPANNYNEFMKRVYEEIRKKP